mmetsp:Transcript_117871/g.338010  ORF Transcript_117871/g.338010 Transcript_117871/m.338010 type:complete len:213 (-) Transcript_117871:231-869(-)
MGAAATQCVADTHEEKFCSAENFLEAAEHLQKCKMPPRCDVLDECIPDKPVGLTDKECTDVLLVQAVVRADIMDIDRALSKGANVNTAAALSINMGEVVPCAPKQVTPLMRACALGHTEVVERLLEARADIWQHDSKGWTPLCHALGAGELDIARRLLRAAGASSERQKMPAQRLAKQILESCEDTAGEQATRDLKKELEHGGFLAHDLRKV